MTATSDFRQEVEIWLYRACAMKNVQYNRYYRNSSFTVDLAMGQIPRSTKRISSLLTVRNAIDKFLKYTASICLTEES